jgi:hypothetical protein
MGTVARNVGAWRVAREEPPVVSEADGRELAVPEKRRTKPIGIGR